MTHHNRSEAAERILVNAGDCCTTRARRIRGWRAYALPSNVEPEATCCRGIFEFDELGGMLIAFGYPTLD
jgi:hypothetical protein